jgi:hypothetical protein
VEQNSRVDHLIRSELCNRRRSAIGGHNLPLWGALLIGIVACHSSSSSPPSDRFFQCVVAGNDMTGQAEIVAYDPSVSGRQQSAPSGNAVQATVSIKTGSSGDSESTVSLSGTWTSSGQLTASNADGYQLKGTMAGKTFEGSLSHAGATANVAGQDIVAGQTASFCGTYSGDSSGNWNLVVSKSGSVSGAFDLGTMSGSAAGDSISLSWSGTSAGTTYSGSGDGTISSAGSIAGSWSGTSSGGMKVSGTWASSATCVGAKSPTVAASGEKCTCAVNGCCPLSSGGSECCVQ